MNFKSAVLAIQKHGILLVYPVANKPLPLSLWSHFFPGEKMKWEWDQDGDARVADMWRLREKLASSGAVVYAKWYQGRATFFSRPVFTSLLHHLNHKNPLRPSISKDASALLALWEENSPRSTKEVKQLVRKQWGWEERRYEKALKELWSRLLVVGVGEVDDGAFPSLSVGATRLLLDDVWRGAQKDLGKWQRCLDEYLSCKSPFHKFFSSIVSESVPETNSKDLKKTITYSELLGRKT